MVTNPQSVIAAQDDLACVVEHHATLLVSDVSISPLPPYAALPADVIKSPSAE